MFFLVQVKGNYLAVQVHLSHVFAYCPPVELGRMPLAYKTIWEEKIRNYTNRK